MINEKRGEIQLFLQNYKCLLWFERAFIVAVLCSGTAIKVPLLQLFQPNLEKLIHHIPRLCFGGHLLMAKSSWQ
jgi:hypothetical protein